MRTFTPLLLLVACCSNQPPPAAPLRTSPSTAPSAIIHGTDGDTYFGETVRDPFRWLESTSDPQVQIWLRKEGAIGQAALDAIPRISDLRAELLQLREQSDSIDELKVAGGHLFYMRRGANESTARLFTRPLGGAERALTTSSAEQAYSISHLSPSRRGKYIAYGFSVGGSEDDTFEIINVESGVTLPEHLEHLTQTELSWSGDDGFYYTRYPHFVTGSEEERYMDPEVMFHRLGAQASSDAMVLSAKNNSSILTDRNDIPVVVSTNGGSRLLALVYRGTSSDVAIFSKSTESGPWTPLFSLANAVSDWAVSGEYIYVISRENNSLGRIVRVNFAHPEAREAVLEPAGRPFSRLVATNSSVYVVEGGDRGSSIRRLNTPGTGATRLTVADGTSVNDVASDPNGERAFFLLEGWSTAARWFEITKDGATISLFPELTNDSINGLVIEHLQATSRDGTQVPITVISRKDTPRDGTAPTILWGYGAYEVSVAPAYTAGRAAWFERGGVMAFAHVRGGGELGKDWHLAGSREHKQNSVDDFIACAEQLIKAGYSSSEHLGAFGSSAGGILVGAAVNQRPELFRAAYIDSGMVNLLGQLRVAIGPANEEEFGAPDTPSAFHVLLRMDAYAQVRRGASYPAMLVATGLNDARVPYWQSAKLVARLKESSASGRPILLRLKPDTGHSGQTEAQAADTQAYAYGFFLSQFGLADRIASPSGHANP